MTINEFVGMVYARSRKIFEKERRAAALSIYVELDTWYELMAEASKDTQGRPYRLRILSEPRGNISGVSYFQGHHKGPRH